MTTTTHADLEALHRHLDEYPDDHGTRRVLADLMEERGDPDGEALRWLAERKKRPVRYLLDRQTADLEWNWYRLDDDEKWGGHPSWFPCAIPTAVFRTLSGQIRDAWRTNRVYPTRREAEADFCRAFHKAKAEGCPHGTA
jgi:hypothetical protein